MQRISRTAVLIGYVSISENAVVIMLNNFQGWSHWLYWSKLPVDTECQWRYMRGDAAAVFRRVSFSCALNDRGLTSFTFRVDHS